MNPFSQFCQNNILVDADQGKSKLRYVQLCHGTLKSGLL